MRGETYEEFVEKFKPKKTTDDCYTPPTVYEAVKNWACRQYGIDEKSIVRPFFPGGDYENAEYTPGCTVLDNPPFSILSKICEFYLKNDINFFLFAPTLTCLSGKNCHKINHLICGADVIYENGAVVNTSFVTNYDTEIVAQTSPELRRVIEEEVKKIKSEKVKKLPKYEYPPHIVTAAIMERYTKYGIDLKIKNNECEFIKRLDKQKEHKKAIFGGGLLLSERAAAERAAKHVWELSKREWEIVRGLSKESEEG